MKRRFTKRATRQYLLSRLPENLLPHKPLKERERRDLLKHNRGDKLFTSVAKRVREAREIGGFTQRGRYLEIDTLEQGARGHNPLRQFQDVTAGTEGLGAKWLPSSLQLRVGLGEQQRGRTSPLSRQIRERRKIRILYGNLSNRELDAFIRSAKTMRGEGHENMFKLLESRLDVVLYRANIFPSITIAQQWIRRGCISLNGRVETHGARRLNPGDVVTPAPELLPALSMYVRGGWREIGARLNTNTTLSTGNSRPKTAPNKLATRSTNLEVSYRSLSVVYLWHVQRVDLPALFDTNQITLVTS